MSAQWQKVKEILQSALERSPDEREQFLDKVCGDDESLRREVGTLFASLENVGNFMEQPAIGAVAEMFVSAENKLQISESLNHYKILLHLGAGGMGEVYLAEDTRLNRFVALKLLPTSLSYDQNANHRLLREAQAASTLDHPHICQIHEIAEADGRSFIVMQFCEGETLAEKLNRKTLNLYETLNLAIQIADALANAHSHHVIHRDIKPANIMVNNQGQAKILDFGLAKIIPENLNVESEAETNQLLSAANIIIGTPPYMSPEQLRGKPQDARTDIFSFGVVLYEMLSGKQVFCRESLAETISAVLNYEPPIAKALADAPPELQRIVQKSLAKDKDDRYQTAKDLLVDLKKLQKRLEFEAELEHSSPPNKQAEDKTQIFKAEIPKETPTLAPNNLTRNLSPIVGREKEIAEIKNLLLQKNLRLLTITGVGGVGKTMLARVVAQRLRNDFDEVLFVELAAVADAELVASTIAKPLGIKEAGGKPILEALKDNLRQRRMLLILDNFEQLISAAPQITELLAAARNLKILITSRVLLHISAGKEFVVPPLAVPARDLFKDYPPAGAGGSDLLDELSNYEAIRLFIERARNAKPSFDLTEENAGDVAEICTRLDGLPLAIELAAARIKILSPRAILAKLENSLKLLAGGASDLDARHQTMRGAIEWSYDLLNEAEKTLFRRLAVFAGGFTFEAAESVVGENAVESEKAISDDKAVENKDKQLTTDHRPPTTDILDLITSLIEQNLLVSKEQANGDARFYLLEVIKEFALEMLEQSSEREQMRRRHAEYFLALGERAEPFLQAAQSADWLNRLEEEHDNLRVALHWAMRGDAELGQRLSGAIWRFWWLHGHIREGCEQLGAFLSHRKAADKAARLKMLLGAGFLNRLRANFALTRSFAEEAVALARETGDKKSGAFASYQLATLALDDEDFNLAGDLFEKGLLLAKDSGDRQILALLLNGLGELARSRADYAPAGDFYRQALAINREIGDLARQVTNLVNLGATAISQKDLKAAGEFYRDGLQISSKLSDMNGTLYCLEGAAGAFWATRDATRAALLFGAAEALRGANNLFIEPADRLPYDQSVALVRASLTEKVFADLFADGRKLKLEEAVALGLADWKTNEASTGEALEARAVSVSAPTTGRAENLFAAADSDDKQIFGYQPKANRTRQTSVFLGLLLVAALGFGLWFFGNRPLNSAPIQSIAVLPFVNAGGNADMEYLSDGMTESLIASLSQLPKLSVKARSSVFRYKGRENVEPQQVGAELSVQAVLTGRVVQRSDNLLLSIDLTDTKTGNAIWTGQYNRKTTDVIKLQSEIARDVSQKLRLRLSGAEEQRVAKSYTTNTEAYQLYLKGRFYWNKRTGEGLKKSVEYFNQAIEQDPNYALAFAGLAESYVIFSGFAVSTPQEAYPKAKAAAKKALEIDETLAEAHAALGLELLAYEWNAEESSREFQRAIELNPNYATARHWYGNQNLLYTGRFDEAIEEMQRAQELDPLSLVINTDLGDTYFYARQYDKAIEQLRKTIEIDQSFYYAHYELGMAYVMKGSYAEAIAQYQKARGLNNDPRVLALLGHALAASGKRNEALKTLSELKETAKQHYVPAYNFAIVYAGLKERDQAFEWLEKSYQDRSSRMAILQVDPFLDNLRSDPRLSDLISRVGLVK